MNSSFEENLLAVLDMQRREMKKMNELGEERNALLKAILERLEGPTLQEGDELGLDLDLF